jgi:hypothetical protein
MSFGADGDTQPAVFFPEGLPLTAIPQQDFLGNIVGWYNVNADGTTTTWDAGGANQSTTAVSPPILQSMFERWGWTPAAAGAAVGSAAGATATAVGQTAGQVVAGAESGIAAALGLTPMVLWLVVGGLAFLVFAGPGLGAGLAVQAASRPRKRRRNPGRPWPVCGAAHGGGRCDRPRGHHGPHSGHA